MPSQTHPSIDDPSELRQRAERYRSMAVTTLDRLANTALHVLADEYDDLATQIEERFQLSFNHRNERFYQSEQPERSGSFFALVDKVETKVWTR